jgi:nucleoside-diphosphate-sugar epimerase
MRIFVAGRQAPSVVRWFPSCYRPAIGWPDRRGRRRRPNRQTVGSGTHHCRRLDEASVRAAVSSVRPDIIIDEMTDLAAVTDFRHFDRAFATTNQLRTRGTDFLLAAAREAGVKRFLAQSFCGWAYGRGGSSVKTEADPLEPDLPQELRRTWQAIEYLERTVTGSMQPEGVVLRYGSFYGPGTGMLAPAMIDQLRRRRVPVDRARQGWQHLQHRRR